MRGEGVAVQRAERPVAKRLRGERAPGPAFRRDEQEGGHAAGLEDMARVRGDRDGRSLALLVSGAQLEIAFERERDLDGVMGMEVGLPDAGLGLEHPQAGAFPDADPAPPLDLHRDSRPPPSLAASFKRMVRPRSSRQPPTIT